MQWHILQNLPISKRSKTDSPLDFVPEDGFDDDLLGDAKDRENLASMTEKERELMIFNRIMEREAAQRRFEIQKKLRIRAQEDKDNIGKKYT